MRVVIVGAGRLGRSLELYFSRAGSRADLIGRGEPVPPSDVVLLCVPDRSLPEAARAVPVGPIVLHCSGASGLEVLAPHVLVGSLHPLMTFPGPEVDLPDPREVPAAVAGGPEAIAAARAIAGTLGFHVFEVQGDRRLYHAAAVLAGNLLTVLGADAVALLRAAGVGDQDARTVWLPLALRSVRNAPAGLSAALTGPVARGDDSTLRAHLDAMREAGMTELADMYEALVSHAARGLEQDRRRACRES